ncbi:unnamed protein product [Rodentolepis nana]|uniref:Protein-L-isoaspartate O-methyltransferase domain-containing protein 2 n=1 Tax=Rodentolepis nana TaxID=102285 RepID=A0A158QI53_RODNA|nr:unnamed protein product [Rodentolepis nana]
MGGVTSFPDNDSLIDSLVREGDFPPHIERVLRLVDRGNYAVGPRNRIYCDSAFRADRLHLSAPSIYATVLRDLNIQPGQSVLNIGSGTGYLSTMFGLLLGSNGLNHGIELHSSNVQFARERLAHFMATSDSLYERDFCPPRFTVGNIFSLVPPSPDDSMPPTSDAFDDPEDMISQILTYHREELTQFLSSANIEPPPLIRRDDAVAESDVQYWPTYDRIYVGAMLTGINQLKAILRLLNVGGSLITPMFDHLFRIDRITETFLNDTVLSTVSFQTIAPPSPDEPNILPFPRREVERLDVLACRSLRQELRKVIIQRNGGHLPTPPRYVRPTKTRQRKEPPPQPTFSGSPPPSPPPADNPAPSTSRGTHASPQASTSTTPSAYVSNLSPSRASSSSRGMSSTCNHSLLMDMEIDIGIDDPDELAGVRPFTCPNSPHRFPLPFPTHPPSEMPQPQSTDVAVTPEVGTLGGGETVDVDTMGSSNLTPFEQLQFIEMISRHFLYCHVPRNVGGGDGSGVNGPLLGSSNYYLCFHARCRQHLRTQLLRLDNPERDRAEDTSHSASESSFESDRASYGDSDSMLYVEEEEEEEEKYEDPEFDDMISWAQSTGHSSQRSQRNKRRKREGNTEESAGLGPSNAFDFCGRRRETSPEVRRRRYRRSRPKVWRRQSYFFQEEMRRLLEELTNEMGLSAYAGELVLRLN